MRTSLGEVAFDQVHSVGLQLALIGAMTVALALADQVAMDACS